MWLYIKKEIVVPSIKLLHFHENIIENFMLSTGPMCFSSSTIKKIEKM